MKNLTIAIISVVASLAASFCAQASESDIITKAQEAYEAENYALACSLYTKVIDVEGTSSDLYYNIGNAQYRNGNMAQAILAYERALRLDPSNADAKANLEFVNARIKDNKGETGSFIFNTANSVVNMAPSNTWAWIALALFAITVAGAVAYFFTESVLLRKIGFFGGIFTLFLAIVAMIFSFRARSIAMNPDYAIITSETSILSTVPRKPISRDEEAMLLHEGTKVRILRSLSQKIDSTEVTWHEVEIDNSHRAWINDADIEKILPD